jgi:hypothetical protein
MQNRLWALTLFFSLNIFATSAQSDEVKRLMVKGEIKGPGLNPISYAHILVKSRNEGWVGDYYGNFRADVYPGDTLFISAISFQSEIIQIPLITNSVDYHIQVVMQPDTVNLKEVLVYPWPATFRQLKKEFIELEIDDPIANLDLHLPSPEELRNLAYPDGGIIIPGPIGLLYDQFSKEARAKKNYAEAMRMEKAYTRYNKLMISRITGLKDNDELGKFMAFCSLQIKFILESMDYELYAAIMNCYKEYCKVHGNAVDP